MRHRSDKRKRIRCVENSFELAHVLSWASRVVMATRPPAADGLGGGAGRWGGSMGGGEDMYAGLRAGVDVVNLEIGSHTFLELAAVVQVCSAVSRGMWLFPLFRRPRV